MRSNVDLLTLAYEDIQMVALGSAPINSANFELYRDYGLCSNVYSWAVSMGLTFDAATGLQHFQTDLFTAMNLDKDFPFNACGDEYILTDDHYSDTKANAARYAWIDGGWRAALTTLEAAYA